MKVCVEKDGRQEFINAEEVKFYKSKSFKDLQEEIYQLKKELNDLKNELSKKEKEAVALLDLYVWEKGNRNS